MTNDKTRTRAGAGALLFGGAVRCCWASLSGRSTATTSAMDKKIFAPARVRMGHWGPPAFAMQSRHIFCILEVIDMVFPANV